jgi:type I restriction enzyme S subunit
MKKYESYKDSGVEWVGEIPSHWVMSRIKFTDLVVMGQSPASEECNLDGKGLPFIQGNAEFGKLYPNPRLYCDTANKMAQAEDVLLSVRAPVGALNIANTDIGIGRGLCAVRPVNSNNKFIYYWLFHSANELESISTGSTFKAVNLDAVRGLAFPMVGITEQTAIASYLDQKTSQIDDLISKKERLIQLLEEERTALINQAVTKGLDPTVPMKDSGIEWLGEIPAHWGRARIKTLVKVRVSDGPHETPEWKEEGIPFISAEAIKDNKIDFHSKRGFISLEQHMDYCRKSKVQKGDILFCKSGSTTGKSALVETDEEFGIWSPLAIIRADESKISNTYMFLCIQSSCFRRQVETSWTYGTQPNIGMGALENLWVAVPPIVEQNAIVEYLRIELSRVEVVLVNVFKEIELLNEYKSALISNVVTGKMNVVNSNFR